MNEFRIKGNLSTEVHFSDDDEEKRQRSWFVVAVNRRGEAGGADFIPCTVFGKSAKACAEHLYKGKEVTVEGRIGTYRPELEDGSLGKTVVQLIARPGGVEFGRDPAGKGKSGVTNTAEMIAGIVGSLAKAGLLKGDVNAEQLTNALAPSNEEKEEGEKESDDDDAPF